MRSQNFNFMVEDACEGWVLEKWLLALAGLSALEFSCLSEAGKRSWPSGSRCSGLMMSKRRHRAVSRTVRRLLGSRASRGPAAQQLVV